MTAPQKYSLLIVAYKASLLQILTFVKHLKRENPSVVIHLLTNLKMDSITCEIKKYVSRVFSIYECKGLLRKSTLIRYFNKFSLFLSVFRLSFRKYDIIDIHFPQPGLLKVMPCFERMSNNILFTPWGSDVLRVTDESAIERMRLLYRYAKGVTTPSDMQPGKTIVKRFKFDPSKMYPLWWGVEYVDFIETAKPSFSANESKARFGVSDRYVISCGYSTAPSHRHLEIVEAIHSINGKLPCNLTLLFPFTYGWGSPKYIQSVKDKCAAYGIHSVFIEEYLDFESLYMLRMATDMFVHVQVSDAGASCVMQYVLCHKKIVHGSWMRYDNLEQYKPLFYFPVDRMEDLAEVILKAYHSEKISIPDGVISEIMNRGWNKVMKQWDSLFRNLANSIHM